MNILVINSGSSSLKYQMFDMQRERLIAKGRVERIGSETALISQQDGAGHEVTLVQEIMTHSEAISLMLRLLTNPDTGVLRSVTDIHGVGHRVVHGGEVFTGEVLINAGVKREIKRLYDVAPLHNPAHMVGITAVEEHLPDVPQVAVFDTAFHQTLPAKAYLYPIPRVLHRKYGIRRYGFHGTSHEYVSRRAALLLGKPVTQLNMVTCHIGNGVSCTAIEAGRSVDTSMGMTPLEGLMMGTRSGDLDPAILPYLMMKEELTLHEISSMLNKHSGLLGVSGISSDVREIQEAARQGQASAILALEMYEYRIRKYIGAYAAAMNGVDAIVFTGGVGENSSYLRQQITQRLTYLGVAVDERLNEAADSGERLISAEQSRVSVLVIPTNEELMIAQKTYALLEKKEAAAPSCDTDRVHHAALGSV
ncbi:acetate kinase [Paenibacillus doosanensis]|uniref:Acetate kinase n=1 Tax=Paenibacillus konkukensis TaxID=2020716 RepID=A0ABY4RVZ3_9BACL|nr:MULTISPECIES: acetate kinase [Paenibacillus]MCS7460942.1 acetate kinase [Paenibacillus doosanensis]UQZ85612.1 Acetate kinase [Paenibacillus konkukensis]